MARYGHIRLVDGVEVLIGVVEHDPLAPDMIRKLANGRPALRPLQVAPEPAHDSDTKRLGPVKYRITPTKVIRTRPVVPLTKAERRNAALARLDESDVGLVTILEDVLLLLASKGVLVETELSQAAQDKLAARRAWRRQVRTL